MSESKNIQLRQVRIQWLEKVGANHIDAVNQEILNLSKKSAKIEQRDIDNGFKKLTSKVKYIDDEPDQIVVVKKKVKNQKKSIHQERTRNQIGIDANKSAGAAKLSRSVLESGLDSYNKDKIIVEPTNGQNIQDFLNYKAMKYPNHQSVVNLQHPYQKQVLDGRSLRMQKQLPSYQQETVNTRMHGLYNHYISNTESSKEHIGMRPQNEKENSMNNKMNATASELVNNANGACGKSQYLQSPGLPTFKKVKNAPSLPFINKPADQSKLLSPTNKIILNNQSESQIKSIKKHTYDSSMINSRALQNAVIKQQQQQEQKGIVSRISQERAKLYSQKKDNSQRRNNFNSQKTSLLPERSNLNEFALYGDDKATHARGFSLIQNTTPQNQKTQDNTFKSIVGAKNTQSLRTIGEYQKPPEINRLNLQPNQQSAHQGQKSSLTHDLGQAPKTYEYHTRQQNNVKPISIWDQMQVHDAELYSKEQEERKRQKRIEQIQMRLYLQNQITGQKSKEQKHRQMSKDVEAHLVQQNILKGQIREQDRAQWLQRQQEASDNLNRLNKMYKQKVSEMDKVGYAQLNEDSSTSRSPPTRKFTDFVPEEGINVICNGAQEQVLAREHKTKKNAMANGQVREQQMLARTQQMQTEKDKSVAQVTNQLEKYKQMDQQRQEFLVKIQNLNQKIETSEKQGKFKSNHAIQQHVKDQEIQDKQEREFQHMQYMAAVLDTRKRFARDVMAQQVKKQLKRQVSEKKELETQERYRHLDEANEKIMKDTKLHSQMIQEETQRKASQKHDLKRDLQNIIQYNSQQRLQNQIGITKEEATMNKKLLESMIQKSPTFAGRGVISPTSNGYSLPIVARK